MFTPEGIFKKWTRGGEVQLGDFEPAQLREWVDHRLDEIADEDPHRVLAEALRLLSLAVPGPGGPAGTSARPPGGRRQRRLDGIARRFGAASWLRSRPGSA